MALFGQIGAKAKGIFGYIEKAVTTALSPIEAIRAVRGAGVEIGDTEFSAAYSTRERAGEIWSEIKRIPTTYRVSERFGVVSPFDWNRKHVMKMEVEFTDLATGDKGKQWITVESDSSLSKQEWEAMGQTAVLDSPMGYQYWIEGVTDYQYYLKE